MSGFDDCIGVFLVATCGCCCLSCTQTDNLWCLLKAPGGDTNYRVRSRSGTCCSCKRAMSDDDFERTVEQLYAPGPGPKPYDNDGNGNGNGNSTHVLELQRRRTRRSGEGERGGDDREGRVTSQPGPRPSMDARRPPSRSSLPENQNQTAPAPAPEGDRERVILESRRDAKARTRDWIAQQTKSVDAGAPAPARAPGTGTDASHRAHQSESHVAVLQLQRPPEAHARAQPSDGFVLPDLNVRGDGSLGRVSAWSHGEKGAGAGAAVPRRGAIPAALMPGRTQNSAPSQLPFDLGPVPGLGQGTMQAGAPPGSSPPSKEVGSATA
ncbi:hypothetical protein LXA43DRAFT_748143 [Ganoderma leucocontextum]|nr:hypothetical protein LXA43DRAFT_748143 [Ganoderma leucocontextum]